MRWTFYYHPLSSFCWKVLVALHEAGVDFEPHQVDLGDPAARAAFQAVWPLCKFPVLHDNVRGRTIPESSIIIDYLARNEPSAASLVPTDPDLALQTRLIDRLIDCYIHLPFQQVVADRLRPPAQRDPLAVERARSQIRSGYQLIAPMITGPWALGDAFTLADCAAFPALFYADHSVTVAEWPALAGYLGRLKARPSVGKVLAEAEPFFQYFPLKDG